jgi:hypothetical protein
MEAEEFVSLRAPTWGQEAYEDDVLIIRCITTGLDFQVNRKPMPFIREEFCDPTPVTMVCDTRDHPSQR